MQGNVENKSMDRVYTLNIILCLFGESDSLWKIIHMNLYGRVVNTNANYFTKSYYKNTIIYFMNTIITILLT